MDTDTLALRVAAEIRAEMGRKGLRGIDVAKLSGIPSATLYKRLNSGATFSIDHLDAIAEVLNVTPLELVRRAGVRP